MEFIKEVLLRNKSPKQVVLKNTFWLSLGQVLSRLFKFLLVIFASRILGPEGWGSFQYVLSIASFFFIFSDLGINYLTVRDYQQKEDFKERVHTGSLIRESLAFLSLVIALIFSLIFENPNFRKTFIILSFFLFFNNIRDYLASFFQAIQKMEKQFFVVFIESLLTLIFGIIFLLTLKNITSLAFAYFLGILFSFSLALILLKDFLIYLKPKFNFQIFKYYLENGLPLALFGMLSFVFFTTDQIILGKLKGVEAVGYYSIATRIILILVTFPSLFLTSLFPQLALSVDNKERLKNIFKKSIPFILLMSFLLFAFILIFADLLPLLFGQKYIPSIQPLKLLSIILLVIPLTNLFDNFLFSINKQWQDFFITLFCALLNVVLNFLLIPQYSIFGAIYATLISQFVNLILTSLLSYRYFTRIEYELYTH
jgi:O-antigen/teichoic acid export membrane protein